MGTLGENVLSPESKVRINSKAIIAVCVISTKKR